MIVRCKYNIGSQIADVFIGYTNIDEKIPIIIDKEYIVYALTEFYNNIWYCIFDESSTSFPMWTPSQFFELTNNRLSQYWVFSLKKDTLSRDQNSVGRVFFGFSEWANELGFYDKLADGEEREVSIFKDYKTLMDLEFPYPSITESAQIGDEQWLICPTCMDAWDSPGDKDGMVICPKCKNVFHNPRYKNI